MKKNKKYWETFLLKTSKTVIWKLPLTLSENKLLQMWFWVALKKDEVEVNKTSNCDDIKCLIKCCRNASSKTLHQTTYKTLSKSVKWNSVGKWIVAFTLNDVVVDARNDFQTALDSRIYLFQSFAWECNFISKRFNSFMWNAATDKQENTKGRPTWSNG